MARIEFDGRTTSDGELRFTPSGQAVFNVDVAENHRKKSGDQWVDDGATFYRVAVFGKRAESLAESIRKGLPVLVVGTFKTREYETRDGGKGRSLDVVADKVALIPTGQPQQQQSYGQSQAPGDPWAAQGGGFDSTPPF